MGIQMEIIRLAKTEDASSILEIYRPYVLETPISFETSAPSLEEMRRRLADTLAAFPWLVFEVENSVIGYAYAGPFKSRCAYSWSVESTVYVKKDCRGRGVGKKLYQELLKRLKDQGAVNAIGGISLPNEASVGLHESLGFRQVAQFKDVGFKLCKWWDVGYWQIQLQKPAEPTPLRGPSCKS